MLGKARFRRSCHVTLTPSTASISRLPSGQPDPIDSCPDLWKIAPQDDVLGSHRRAKVNFCYGNVKKHRRATGYTNLSRCERQACHAIDIV